MLIFKILVGTIITLVGPTALFAQDKELKALSQSISESLLKASQKTVAVVDFTDLQGDVTELGRYLAEEVSIDIAAAGSGIEVVDRTHLKALLQENKLSASGIIDPSTARKLGQITGVEVLITGTITPFSDSVRCLVKALHASTAHIITAASAEIPRTTRIIDLEKHGIGTSESDMNGTSAMSSSQPTQTSSKSNQRTSAENYTFELQSCEMSGSSVSCNLLVTNTKLDRDLVIGGNMPNWGAELISQMFDEFGGTYKVQSVGLGNQAPSRGGSYHFVSGVPTPVTVNVSNVAVKTTRIALLDILCIDSATVFYGCISGKKFQVRFRNIPVVK